MFTKCLVWILSPMSQNLIGYITFIKIIFEIIVSLRVHNSGGVLSHSRQGYLPPAPMFIFVSGVV